MTLSQSSVFRLLPSVLSFSFFPLFLSLLLLLYTNILHSLSSIFQSCAFFSSSLMHQQAFASVEPIFFMFASSLIYVGQRPINEIIGAWLTLFYFFLVIRCITLIGFTSNMHALCQLGEWASYLFYYWIRVKTQKGVLDFDCFYLQITWGRALVQR